MAKSEQRAQAVDSILQYAETLGVKAEHRLVAVADLAHVAARSIEAMRLGFYCVMLLDGGDGQGACASSAMAFTSPGQIFSPGFGEGGGHPRGYLLMFHPDFIAGTRLADMIGQCYFFGNGIDNALPLADTEKAAVIRIFQSIESELALPPDKHTSAIVEACIETLLNYSLRYFDRGCASVADDGGDGIAARMAAVLDDYYAKGMAIERGMPTVGFCAKRINLSANYLGDLIKKETGMTARQYIHSYVIDKAKLYLKASSLNVSEVAYSLGFRYPHHFSRLFKRIAQCAPTEYKTKTRL